MRAPWGGRLPAIASQYKLIQLRLLTPGVAVERETDAVSQFWTCGFREYSTATSNAMMPLRPGYRADRGASHPKVRPHPQFDYLRQLHQGYQTDIKQRQEPLAD